MLIGIKNQKCLSSRKRMQYWIILGKSRSVVRDLPVLTWEWDQIRGSGEVSSAGYPLTRTLSESYFWVGSRTTQTLFLCYWVHNGVYGMTSEFSTHQNKNQPATQQILQQSTW